MTRKEWLRQLGIAEDADGWTGTRPTGRGDWRIVWAGIRLRGGRSARAGAPVYRLGSDGTAWLEVELWSRIVINERDGFQYEVRWHPTHGRSYHVVSPTPDMPQLREAQALLRRDPRGRKPKMPATAAAYIATYRDVWRKQGTLEPPTRARMADEFGVTRRTEQKFRKDHGIRLPLAKK